MIDIGKISEEEKTPLVVDLMHAVQSLHEDVQRLRDEIARLKQHKGKPKIPPSRLEKEPRGKRKKKTDGRKRQGSEKRSKTKDLPIHETIPIAPADLPAGSTRVGHDDWIVQGLDIRLHNVCYQLEIWRTPDGALIKGKLPDSVDGHFNTTLRSFILQQYNHGHVTQPLIWEELLDFGVDISSGQVNRILTEQKELFHIEKEGMLSAGLEVSDHINVDDTGARHAGKNGYCTHIGNDLFAWFQSTESKSRINFLQLLRKGHGDYVISEDALSYIKQASFPQPLLARLAEDPSKHLATEADWKLHLDRLGISKDRHVRIATEGALLGSVLHHGFSKDLVIVSDDAGQFNILLHALCWVHAERTIHKLIGCSENESKAIENVRDHIWRLYRDLKAYKEMPDEQTKLTLEKRFDEIFATRTGSDVLDAALRRVARNKAELLLVLDRPDIPLHNNLSERDIREYVKKRKISGSTRSDNGRRCRDTFTSLKKTCRKLGVSFWNYLNDRVSNAGEIPPLPDLIRAKAQSA
jgi:hypothetical protein